MIFVNDQVQAERVETCRRCPLVIVAAPNVGPRDTLFQKAVAAVKDLNELRCSVCKCPSKLRAKQSVVGCPKRMWRR